MKLCLFLLGLLTTLTAIATPGVYTINSQLFINGRHISSPKIITSAGESAEIIQQSGDPNYRFTFKVTPDDYSNDKIQNGIIMNFEIEYKYLSESVKVTPQVIVKSGSEASVSIGHVPNQDLVLLKVTATRQQ